MMAVNGRENSVLNDTSIEKITLPDFYHTIWACFKIPLQLKVFIMRATFPTHQTRNNTSDKLIKLVQGKGYLEILMYLLAVSASVVILFA